MEEWRDIPGYKGLYQVSNLGRIKSLIDKKYDLNENVVKIINRERILKQNLTKKGYCSVKLYKNGKGKTYKIHRLVAEIFIPNPENKPQVNHIDGNKQNNCVTNLEWNTNEENFNNAIKINLIKTKRIRLIDENNKEHIFDKVQDVFKHIKKQPSGVYKKYINKNKLFLGYYWYYI